MNIDLPIGVEEKIGAMKVLLAYMSGLSSARFPSFTLHQTETPKNQLLGLQTSE